MTRSVQAAVRDGSCCSAIRWGWCRARCGRSFAGVLLLIAACGGGGGGGSSSGGGPVAPPPDTLSNLAPTAAAQLSPGNAVGQDEDPTVLRTANALNVAWFSDRNGLQADGVVDREIFFVRTTDGRRFTDPPLQITRADRYSFYPRLAAAADGSMHLAWWRVIPTPEGCVPGVNCGPGTLNRIMYKRANVDGSWNVDEEQAVAVGPGDWLPSLVIDRRNGNVLVYFSSPVRDDQGNVNLALSTLRIYRVIFDGTQWSMPVMVQNASVAGMHNTYPMVVQRTDNTFMMVWTRYPVGNRNFDPLQVISEPAAETWFGESSDGLAFTAMRQLSDGASTAAPDAFPSLYQGDDGTWFAVWQSGTVGGGVEAALTGPAAFTRVMRPEIGGNTPQLVATPTPGVLLAVWSSGVVGREKVSFRYFRK